MSKTKKTKTYRKFAKKLGAFIAYSLFTDSKLLNIAAEALNVEDYKALLDHLRSLDVSDETLAFLLDYQIKAKRAVHEVEMPLLREWPPLDG